MHAISRTLLVAVGAVLIAAGFAPHAAQAQRYGDRDAGQQVYCASNDTRGTRCQMPWRDSALAQQMSKSPCIEGQTWGSDPYTVWIKGGCRGNFRDARAWNRPDYGNRPGAEVYCASNDNRGTRCKMPWRRSELSRQMSNAACVEGQTWGSDPYSVWIKGGCRAQFRAARGGRPRW